MKIINDLDYFKLSKFQKIWYKISNFLKLIPKKLIQLFLYIFNIIKKVTIRFINEVKLSFITFIKGNIKIKISYFVMG